MFIPSYCWSGPETTTGLVNPAPDYRIGSGTRRNTAHHLLPSLRDTFCPSSVDS